VPPCWPRAPAPSRARLTPSVETSPAPAETSTVRKATVSTAVAGSPTVYFLPFDDFPDESLERLQDFFETWHGISVGILPRLRVGEDAIHPERQQIVSGRLLDDIEAARRGDHPDWVIIGLTEYDIMMEDKPEWQFVFSLRSDVLGSAVVSVARMDPRNFGLRANEDRLFERTSKMVGKNIGALHLGLPMTDDPSSVMYSRLLSVDALDAIADDFALAAPVSGATSRQ